MVSRRQISQVIVLALLSTVVAGAAGAASERPVYLDTTQPVEKRVNDLIARLTLEEKAMLLNHRGTTVERFDIRSDQWNQCLHGVCWDRPTTMFPISIAMAATWDTKLVHEEATVISDEARAVYNLWHQQPDLQAQHKGLIYRGPVINIGRNPYWGRNEEAYGEDPFLTGRMAVAYVTGLQGDDPKYLKLVSTLKHDAVNNVEQDRQSLSATVSEQMLHEYWLPHFRDAIVEGQAQSVMASYNAINGVPSNINPLLLTEILKKQWGFQGFVVSDLGGVNTMVKGHMKGKMTYEDAVAKSLIAGCDFSDKEFETYLPTAVRQGLLPEEQLNDAVYRVMRDRFRLGEFDPPEMVPYSKISPSVICSPEHRALALEAARESIVLLTNRNGLLPLDKSKLKKIAVIGPHADLFTPGGYSGKADNPVTPLQGITNRAAPATEILCSQGCEIARRSPPRSDKKLAKDEDAMIREAVETAGRADVAIVYVGTTNAVEAEGRDRTSLGLPGRQEELVKAVLAANSKTVVVLMNAGPLTIPWIKDHAPAILEAWWNGVEGGNAIADVLFGEYNPAGRLPHTVYASESQVPLQDQYDVTKGFTYMYLNGEPLFAFGHGLSYTTFKYGKLELSDTQIARNGNPLASSGGALMASIEVTNTGKREGDEVVQLYIHEVNPVVKRPVKELRGFERISLKPGETKKVTVTVPAEKLAHYDEAAHSFVVKPGAFDVMVGSSSDDIRAQGRFTVLGEAGGADRVSSLAVEHLRCEYREDPMGIESAQPRLSWWLRSDVRGQTQAAYQVLVASLPEVLARGQGDLWDSGRVASDQSVLVAYQGKPLAAMQRVWWKVRAWPQKPGDGQSSAWSASTMWTMGLPQPQDWRAKWITFDTKTEGRDPSDRGQIMGKDGKPIPPLPLLRKTFQVDKAVRRAVVCICGLGQYELAVNGNKIGDHVVDPGWTDYRKRCLYAMYDVTASLRRGENVLAVMLGNGMYNVTGGRYTKFQGSFGSSKLILQLQMDFADDTSVTIVSDETWKGTAGPIRFSCTYGGEDFDARAEQGGWDSPGFEDKGWATVSVSDGPGGRLEAQAQPPVKVMREFKTIRVTEPQSGILVYDLGQNFSGWPTLKAKGPAGSRVRLIPGELLDAKSLVTQRSSGGPAYFAYTLKGTREETWHPRFSYYGFRYVQAERLPAAGQSEVPEILRVGGQFICSSAATVGTFECSNPLVNRIHKLIDAAIMSNLQSVLTDCPHREKLGWLEVSHLLGCATMFNYDVPNFYAKICRDMADSQTADGLVPDIAPEYVVFNDGFRDSPEWGSAAVIDPWLVYQMYGDSSLLEKHYDVMARYVAYLGSKAKDHIVSHGLGDWYDIGPKPPGVSQLTSLGVTATAVYYQDVKIMEEAARILGRQEDVKKYGDRAVAIRDAFNKTFFHPETASYDRNSQTANAMPLVLGLVPPEKRSAVAETLARGIRENGNRVTAGDVGFHYVVAALTENGRDDVLYDMVTQDAGPGYAYQLKNGATTLTEAWDTNPASSQNHCMLGHAEEWFYRGLGGIRPADPGFRTITIKPAIVGEVSWTRAAYESVRGKVCCAWRRGDGRVRMQVEVPVGAEAIVYVPAKNAEAVTESGKPAAQAETVRFVKMEGGAAVFHTGSGAYSFESGE
ncbi:MAG: family 78 glycoside hydrolase catalytic domain [Phycisphaerae bacterium]|nr:family 78 glycoside hydrolase catalytic domain [Phycisphaerae bacterium]